MKRETHDNPMQRDSSAFDAATNIRIRTRRGKQAVSNAYFYVKHFLILAYLWQRVQTYGSIQEKVELPVKEVFARTFAQLSKNGF